MYCVITIFVVFKFNYIYFIFTSRGLWNVPFVTNCYLINASLLHQYERSILNYGKDLDPDMDFCAILRNLVSTHFFITFSIVIIIFLF